MLNLYNCGYTHEKIHYLNERKLWIFNFVNKKISNISRVQHVGKIRKIFKSCTSQVSDVSNFIGSDQKVAPYHLIF